jgi:tRNA threonylcarbamoyladenosine biosynthesis protein TsaE
MRARRIDTAGPAETEALAASLGATAEPGAVVGLDGELGAGKTCFVRGLFRGLGGDPELVASPTFVLATENAGGRLPLHHVDLYRLEPPLVDTLFLRDVLDGTSVVAIEWFGRLAPDVVDEVLHVTLTHGTGDERSIRFEAQGPRHTHWLARALER